MSMNFFWFMSGMSEAVEKRKKQVKEQPEHNNKLRELSFHCPRTIAEYLIQRREASNKVENTLGVISIRSLTEVVENHEAHLVKLREILKLQDNRAICDSIDVINTNGYKPRLDIYNLSSDESNK